MSAISRRQWLLGVRKAAQRSFVNIMTIGEENGVAGENHPAASSASRENDGAKIKKWRLRLSLGIENNRRENRKAAAMALVAGGKRGGSKSAAGWRRRIRNASAAKLKKWLIIS